MSGGTVTFPPFTGDTDGEHGAVSSLKKQV